MAFGFLKKIGGAVFGVAKGAVKFGVGALTGQQIGASAFPPAGPVPVPSYGFAPPTAPPPGTLSSWNAAIRAVVDQAGEAIQSVRDAGRTIAATDPQAVLAEARKAAGGLGAIEKLQQNLPLLLAAVVIIVLLRGRG